HGHAGNGRFDRNTGIHECECSTAYRGHRRGTIRFENVGDDANRIRPGILTRYDRQQRALGESAVTDFAASGAAQKSDFTDREGREVVVHHEALVRLAFEGVQALDVVTGPECSRYQRLRLSAREHRRTMGSRENARFDPDVPDRIELAFVRTLPLVQNLIAEDSFLQPFEDAFDFSECFVVAL